MLYLGDVPESCNPHLNWAFNIGKHTGEYYHDMKDVAGVSAISSSRNDIQRYFTCKDIQKADCDDKGLTFPATCSEPPCNQCYPGNINNKRIKHEASNHNIYINTWRT